VHENPLYKTWIDVSFDDLLKVKDDKAFTSFLNADKLEQVADEMSRWGTGVNPAPSISSRPWLSDKLRVIATLSNITGFPYSIAMTNNQLQGGSGLGHSMTLTADWARFVVDVPGGTGDSRNWPGDERALDRNKPDGWNTARDAALGTCAFPGAFPSRQISRDENFAGYRFICIPGVDAGNPTRFEQLVPVWPALLAGATRPNLVSLNVDGGACNNEPIDIARRALAGGDARNPRKGTKANRAVILIDPFSDPDDLGPTTATSPFPPLLRLIGSLISQARYKPEDLALAQDEACFSRFLIAPVGPGSEGSTSRVVGAKAIASGSLFGFGAFLSKSFRTYDFILGRYNAEQFLKKHFMLPKESKLFGGGRWPENGSDWEDTEDSQVYRPIIPVMSTVPKVDEPGFLPKITQDALDKLFAAAAARIDWIYERIKDSALNGNLAGWKKAAVGGYLWIGWKLGGRGAANDAVKGLVTDELKSRNMLG
jgi:hypothetical protein